jgi:hypothetical protein
VVAELVTSVSMDVIPTNEEEHGEPCEVALKSERSSLATQWRWFVQFEQITQNRPDRPWTRIIDSEKRFTKSDVPNPHRRPTIDVSLSISPWKPV